MQAIEGRVQPEFQGSEAAQELASRVFGLVVATARFYGQHSPVVVSLDAIAEFVASADGGEPGDVRETIDASLTENDHVFRREEREGEVVFVTSRSGMVPVVQDDTDHKHTFAKRFEDPLPIPESHKKRRSSTAVSDLQSDEPEADAGEVAETEVEAEQPESVVEPEPETVSTAEESAVSPAPTASDLVDVDESTDEEIAEALRVQLAYDYSVANFGDQWMAEEKVPRLSRGDLRRIRDYIVEQQGPVSDEQIVQDLLGIRPSAPEYHLHRFSVNFRLSRETREFEFVGLPGAHFWTTTGISSPGVVGRKPAEVGQDYRVLLDLPDAQEIADEGVIEHVLTFYEYRHGVLPYDAAFRSIVPGPVLEGQRTAIVRFDSPLTHESFPVEVRFPTGSRGGFLAGFAEFFKEHLVPGAFLTIEAGETPGTYTLEFLTVSGQDRKLLSLDEKKGQYKFEPVTFYCAPNEDMLLTENRIPKLAGTSPIDERTRRQPELVLARAFEFVGEQVDANGDGQLMAVIDELVSAANIERPIPAAMIRQIASSEEHPAFSIDPEADDVIYYKPGSESASAS